jgi:SPP1 gp7 family putative phage head morphogenesis protein
VSFDLSAKTKRRAKKAIAIALVALTHAQELQLYAIYLQVVKLWEEASTRISEAYATSLDAGGPSNGPGDAARVIDATAASAAAAMILIPGILRQFVGRAEMVHQAKWVRAAMAATKVDIRPMLGPSDVTAILKASADWNAALVKDVSGQIQRQVSNIVFSGFQSKTSVYEVAKEISKTTGIARRRARNIAYDQINKLGAALNRARREQAGIDSYIWTHSAKLHARPTHLARNGMIFKNDDPRIPKGDRCSEPPFCGCHERAVIPARQEVAA